jgi:alkaline phosphatase D
LTANETDPDQPGNPPISLGPLWKSGETTTSSSSDYTIKIDVTGLQPWTTYYYQFEVQVPAPPSTPATFTSKSQQQQQQHQPLWISSPAGRTKTLPHPSNPLTNSTVQFGVVSCSNYPSGFFNSYSYLAARDEVDIILHLGDYIYEYKNGEFGDGTAIDRIAEPDKVLVGLDDYRARHAFYKTDPDLQALHRVKPFITIWGKLKRTFPTSHA